MGSRTGRAVAWIVVIVVGSLAAGGPVGRATPPPAGLRVHGADTSQERMVGWAVGRFRSANLADLPALDIVFHADASGCRGGFGFYRDGRVDLCTGVSTNLFARKVILHELSHAWIEANVDPSVRERFLELRGIREWNGRSVPWRQRGWEQGAEIVAWAIGEGVLSPMVPDPTDDRSLIRAFELLTGTMAAG